MAQDEIHGESVFAVEIVPQGVQVKTVFLTQQGEVLNHPAVFPNEEYAYQQIDALKQVVAEKFAQIKESQKASQATSKNVAKPSKSPGTGNVIDLFKR